MASKMPCFFMTGSDYYLKNSNSSVQLLSVQLHATEVTVLTQRSNCTEMFADCIPFFPSEFCIMDNQIHKRVEKPTNRNVDRVKFKLSNLLCSGTAKFAGNCTDQSGNCKDVLQ